MGEEKRLVAGSVAFCAMLGLEATSEEREALESQLHSVQEALQASRSGLSWHR